MFSLVLGSTLLFGAKAQQTQTCWFVLFKLVYSCR